MGRMLLALSAFVLLSALFVGGFVAIMRAIIGVLAGIYWIIARMVIASFARYRELSADRGGVAVTGNPAQVASALETMERGSYASTDLRLIGGNAFAITPLSKSDTSWATDWRTPIDWIPSRLRGRFRALLTFHPPIDRRIEYLQELERKR